MSYAATPNQDGAENSRPNHAASDAASDDSVVRKSSPDLLRYVLEETLAKGENVMSGEEWQAMRAVAQEFQGQNKPVDQIAVRLVDAFLTSRFEGLQSGEAHEAMCRRIADSLCADPVSMQRIKVFWNQLQETVR